MSKWYDEAERKYPDPPKYQRDNDPGYLPTGLFIVMFALGALTLVIVCVAAFWFAAKWGIL